MCWSAWWRLILFVCTVRRDKELIGAWHPVIFSNAPQPLARFKIPAGYESGLAMALQRTDTKRFCEVTTSTPY